MIVPFVAVIVVFPADNAVNLPLLSIVPTDVLLLAHFTRAETFLLNWSNVFAINDLFFPTIIFAVGGTTFMVVNTGVCTGAVIVTVTDAVPFTVPFSALMVVVLLPMH